MRIIKAVFHISFTLFLTTTLQAQATSARLQKAYAAFENDPQLKYASHSLYVVEVATGKPVFSKNIRQGLAPASTQKVVTAAAAYAILGQEFQYNTSFGLDPETKTLFIRASGDPSFGSIRYATTKPERLVEAIADSFSKNGISNISGWKVLPQSKNADTQLLPDGWIVQDIGNYYGAGAMLLNWRENEYELLLKSTSKIGDPVEIVNKDKLPSELQNIDNQLKSAAAGSGDNAYIYLPFSGNRFQLKGTIPVGQSKFSISGAVTNSAAYFMEALQAAFAQKGMVVEENAATTADKFDKGFTPIATVLSPTLDSLSYWFLRRSINLYGEAFLKTLGENKSGEWSAEAGLVTLRKFWAQQNIDSFALRMYDGSGLSPQNRVTTQALVQVLQYARGQKWFGSYYAGFPNYNGMLMKSGTINGVKGFCGYHKSKKDGKEYVFAFLVNNHSGSSAALVKKMFAVLDELK